jgi:amino acid transporter
MTTVIYLAVIVVSICVLGYDTVSQSYHPLSVVYETLVGKKTALITYIAGIFILFNTAFVSLIGATRFMYGLGQKKEIAFAEKWCELNENKTPTYAILFTFVLSVILALVNNEVVMAVFCNFSVMLILILLSVSLLMIRWKERNNLEEQSKHNYIKGNINNIPLIVLISMVVMIFFKYTILKNKFWLE